MKILSYNILSGGFNSYNYESPTPERLGLLEKVIHIIHADFVGLIDTFRWDSLYSNDQLCQIFGYKNAYCINLNDERLKKKGHSTGITVLTNLPVESFETISLGTRDAIKTDIRINNNKLDIFTVYLDDLDEDTRIGQINALLSQRQDSSTIIMGDLNTLSPDEATRLTPLINKFFTEHPNLSESFMPVLDEMKRGEVTRILERHRFLDADKNGTPTAPSKLFPVRIESALFRVDYAFHTKDIQISNFKVPKDSILDQTSDHYPIVFEVDIKNKNRTVVLNEHDLGLDKQVF